MLLKWKRILNPWSWSVLEFQLEIRTHMTLDTEGNVQILNCKLQKAGLVARICQTWNIYLNVPTMRRPVWQMEAKLIYDNNNNDLMTRTEYKIVPGPSPISSGKQWKRQKQKELLIVDRNSGLGIWKLFLIFSDDGQRPACSYLTETILQIWMRLVFVKMSNGDNEKFS